jgi:hypothetical protein
VQRADIGIVPPLDTTRAAARPLAAGGMPAD